MVGVKITVCLFLFINVDKFTIHTMDEDSDATVTNSNVEENSTSFTSIYSYVFEFERQFSSEKARTWMSDNWIYGLYFSGVYVFLIFSLQHYMRNRRRFDFGKTLVGWNIMIAVFSIFGAVRTLKEMFHVLWNYGLYDSICTPR